MCAAVSRFLLLDLQLQLSAESIVSAMSDKANNKVFILLFVCFFWGGCCEDVNAPVFFLVPPFFA